MFFAALTSAYLVKRGQSDWIHFDIPSLFGYTAVVALCSSVSMQLSYIYTKRNNIQLLKIMLLVTLLQSVAFLSGQYMGWRQLVASEVYLVGHPSGSFIYVISGAHALHVLGGIVFLMVVLVEAFRYRVGSENTKLVEMCATYWHFVGILWIYLYVFFSINQ